MDIKKVNIAEKLTLFKEHWTPKIIGDLNDQHIKLAKVQGELVWHSHAHEDELFIILKGTLYLEFKDQTISLNPGEMLVVPMGVEHRPYTDGEEVHLMLIEPKSTKHTGEVISEKTVTHFERI